jgi:hypothetical protein
MTEKLGDAQHRGDWYTHTPSSARPTQLQWLLLCQASVSETRKKDVTIPPRSARSAGHARASSSPMAMPPDRGTSQRLPLRAPPSNKNTNARARSFTTEEKRHDGAGAISTAAVVRWPVTREWLRPHSSRDGSGGEGGCCQPADWRLPAPGSVQSRVQHLLSFATWPRGGNSMMTTSIIAKTR